MVEFGLPGGPWRPPWWLYTRIGLPLAGRVVSARWSAVGAFLGPSIERFYARHPLVAAGAVLARRWPRRRAHAPDEPRRRHRHERDETMSAAMSATNAEPPADARQRIARARVLRGARRRMARLLDAPPSAVHRLAPLLRAPRCGARAGAGPPDRRGGARRVRARRGRRRARVRRAAGPAPANADPVARAGRARLGGAAGRSRARPRRGAHARTALPRLRHRRRRDRRALCVRRCRSSTRISGSRLGWGAFPVVTVAYATGAQPVPIALAALGAALLSLAQRRLSTRARSIRRRAVEVSGEIVYADGSREAIERADAHQRARGGAVDPVARGVRDRARGAARPLALSRALSERPGRRQSRPRGSPRSAPPARAYTAAAAPSSGLLEARPEPTPTTARSTPR